MLLLPLATAPISAAAGERSRGALPWKAAGLTERQAAAHLLDRFAFGARPGDVDRLVAQGLERWLEAQLAGTVEDAGFAQRVRPLDAWAMSPAEIQRTFPPYPVLRREAMRAGLVDRATAAPEPGEQAGRGSRGERRRAVLELYEERGWRAQRELLGQLTAHKLIEAVHSERQLEAVLGDFWFNHFNVSLTDNQARTFLLSYQRDAIAPHVLGGFEDLLTAVAAHPAMLHYLDNAQSTASATSATTLERRRGAGLRPGMRPGTVGGAGARRPGPGGRGPTGMDAEMAERVRANRPRGLNENFARELLELHTLGVDGGYTQEDVIAVARAFTGWTVLPPAAAERARAGGGGRGRGAAPARTGPDGTGFLFRPDAHDAEPKVVLGRRLAGGRGIEDGLEVLELVAHHPSTARHLARKLAVRFVADDPPPALVERLAVTWLESRGDLRQVTRALAYSPEFWSREARGAKIKSPFEVAVSAVRALGGEVPAPPRADTFAPGLFGREVGPPDLAFWIGRMGQPLYAYQAPTGYPDRAEAWVSTGALLSRMNFGLHLAAGRVAGVRIDLGALSDGHEPESLEQALAWVAPRLLPERPLEPTLERLGPVVRDPELVSKVERAAAAENGEQGAAAGGPERMAAVDPMAHVVGVVLGSPEFQRR